MEPLLLIFHVVGSYSTEETLLLLRLALKYIDSMHYEQGVFSTVKWVPVVFEMKKAGFERGQRSCVSMYHALLRDFRNNKMIGPSNNPVRI